jgi:hypothetical protein
MAVQPVTAGIKPDGAANAVKLTQWQILPASAVATHEKLQNQGLITNLLGTTLLACSSIHNRDGIHPLC